jgi:hypothetical protein
MSQNRSWSACDLLCAAKVSAKAKDWAHTPQLNILQKINHTKYNNDTDYNNRIKTRLAVIIRLRWKFHTCSLARFGPVKTKVRSGVQFTYAFWSYISARCMYITISDNTIISCLPHFEFYKYMGVYGDGGGVARGGSRTLFFILLMVDNPCIISKKETCRNCLKYVILYYISITYMIKFTKLYLFYP